MRSFLYLCVLSFFLSCVVADNTAQTSVVQNWNGQINSVPLAILTPANLTELQSIIQFASANSIEVKVTGASHSFSGIFQTNGYLLKLTNIDAVTILDPVNLVVRAQAGITINALDTFLTANGMAIPTGTVIDDITLGGSVAAGCHGAGKNYGLVADLVVQMRIVDSNGILQTYSGFELNTVKVNLGLFGVIYDIDLQLVPAQNLQVSAQSYPYNTTITGPALQGYFNAYASLEVYTFPFAPTVQVRTTNPSTAPSNFNYTAYVEAGEATVATGLAYAPLFESSPDTLYYIATSGEFTIFANMVGVWPMWAAVHYGYGLQGGPAFFNPEYVRGFNNNPTDWATNAAMINYLTNLNNYYFFTYGQAPVTYGLDIRFTASSDATLSPCNVNYDYCMWIDILLGVNAAGTTNYMNEIYPVLTAAPYNAAPHWAKTWSQIPKSQNLKIAEVLAYRAISDVDPKNMYVNDAMFRVFVDDFASFL